MSAQPSDAVVIEHSLVEPQAFAAIFDRHFDAVHAYARRRLGGSLAEEVASETFVRAFDRRRTFDRSRVDARPWLFGIAANLMRRHWRTERRRLRALARLQPGRGEEPWAEERADLVPALDALPAREREALFLYALVDLSYEEIAEALDVPIGTVRSRLSRARDRIRKQLIPEGVL
ncbi:MAG TPA: RNA polymerase sigma factor [Gaiellaceae bacterium]|jgi:RNA polymerase sigma factor (sigma-70 family)|nr:RNA polymerase sigma factor [Gaiellaceae bacterium]